MLHRSRSREYGSSTSGSTCFSRQQMGEFLSDLRMNRPPRPNGSRPPPDSTQSPSRRSMHVNDTLASRSSTSSDSSKMLGHSRSSSSLSFYHKTSTLSSGRTSPEKMHMDTLRDQEKRRAEREQSHAVRIAMDALHVDDGDTMTREAQKQTLDLVSSHQNSGRAYRSPDHPSTKLKPALPLDPSEITDNVGPNIPFNTTEIENSGPSKYTEQSYLSEHVPEKRRSLKRIRSGSSSKKPFPNSVEKIWQDSEAKLQTSPTAEQDKKTPAMHIRRNPFARAQSAKQNIIPVSQDTMSDKPLEKIEIYQNPPSQSRNPSYISNQSPTKNCSDTTSNPDSTEATELRYKDGIEVRSDDIRTATSRSLRDRSPRLPSPAFVSDSPERPIVSFRKDWRPVEKQANGKNHVRRLENRPSPEPNQKLDQQSATSSKSVSAPAVPTLREMDEASRARSEALSKDIEVDGLPDVPEISVTGVPSIQIDASPQQLNQTPDIPILSIEESDTPASIEVTPTPKPRPNRAANVHATRPIPRHAATAPTQTPTTRITPHAMREGSALCAQCALPIYGRTVTAAGTRFHPECFTCFHCGEALECVQFYPEPGSKREERLQRIEKRMAGEEAEPPHGYSMEDDSDDALRFYCHLDYHEFFSPRCSNCKTPIEGEMIVALGGQYHSGHFFCANCGDVSSLRSCVPGNTNNTNSPLINKRRL